MAFLTPNDVLGRKINFLGSKQRFDLTDTLLTFVPVFTCGDRQNPATDQKKTVIPWVAFSDFTGPVAGTVALGASPTGTDWCNATDLAVWANGSQPFLLLPLAAPSQGSTGAAGYAPGTIFGCRVAVAATGTCTVTAYGWGE